MSAVAVSTPPLVRAERPVLEVERLGVRLGGRDVLRDVSFSVAPGSLTALIGSNGAGKTTLLRALLGLQAIAGGEVRIDGALRTRRTPPIGYVPQKVLLDPEMALRARDVVALGIDGNRLGFPLRSRRRRERVEEMLEAVGAGHLADARAGRLSGGEQQRVLIAHALAGRPRLLLLDEPLANLDLASEQSVAALLARVAHEQGVAVLLSAHDMNALLPVMDGIVYLAAGRAASGPPGDIVTSEALSDLYGHPVEVLRVGDRVIVVAGSGVTRLAADPVRSGSPPS